MGTKIWDISSFSKPLFLIFENNIQILNILLLLLELIFKN
jgi:hypothetical protein